MRLGAPLGLIFVMIALVGCGKSNLQTPRQQLVALITRCRVESERPAIAANVAALQRCLREHRSEFERLEKEACRNGLEWRWSMGEIVPTCRGEAVAS